MVLSEYKQYELKGFREYIRNPWNWVDIAHLMLNIVIVSVNMIY